MVEVPDFIARAIAAQGKTTPEEVAAALSSVDLDTVEPTPTTPEEEAMEQETLDLGPDLCPECKGERFTETRTGERRRCGLCNALPTDGLAQGRALRDEGVARAERAAPSDWKLIAVRVLNQLIEEGNDFTADDIWARVGFKPPEPRALGGLLTRASRGGRIVQTGERRPSKRPEHHAFPMAVWRPVRRG